jgi:hypothetical protein
LTATKRALELTHAAATAAVDKLGTDLVAYDVSEQLAITDVFLVITASNERRSALWSMGSRSRSADMTRSPYAAKATGSSVGSYWITSTSWYMCSTPMSAVSTRSSGCGGTVQKSSSAWMSGDDGGADHPVAPRSHRVEHRQSLSRSGRYPLDQVGYAQAERAAEVLARYQPSSLYSSDLSRCYQTAEMLAQRTGLEIITDKRLREIHVGSWEGLLGDEIKAADPELARRLRAGEDVRRSPTGESPVRSASGWLKR